MSLCPRSLVDVGLRRLIRLAPAPALAVVLAVAALAPARPAQAVEVSLGLGGHYWFAEQAIFDADAVIRQRLAGSFSIGGRVGVALGASPVDVGIPLDFLMRLDASRFYFEVAGGAWIFFDAERVRPHVSGGFGLVSGNLTFGPEVGWLEPRAIMGLRLTYRL